MDWLSSCSSLDPTRARAFASSLQVVSGDVAKHLVAISSIEAEPVGGGARNPAARRERLLDALQQRAISYVARGIIGGGSAADGTRTGADGGGEGSRELRAATLLLAGIASFNLFLQVNYTGPMIEPAAMLAAELLHVRALFGDDDEASHAYALSLLEVEGELPSRLAKLPALLVLARIWLRAAAGSGSNWARSCTVATVRAAEARAGEGGTATASASAPASSPSSEVVGTAAFTAAWWCSRAVVAHERLLVAAKSVPETLWAEAALLFDVALARFGRSGRARAGGSGGGTAGASHVKRERVDANANGKVKVKGGFRSAQIWLEWGLAESHFDRPSKGRESFASAQKASGLVAELVGAMGKRTKFQQRSLAQMVVMARSVSVPAPPPSGGAPAAPEAVKPPPPPPAAAASSSSAAASDDARGDAAAPPSEAAELGELGGVPVRAAQHPSDGILYETTQFDAGTGAVGDEQPNLHPLDQAILLAQCLDVANSNPKDGLTSEQMMPYLQRVLQHPNNWMIYSTSLLQRAHLEAESAHSCDRAILQIQALVDQHTSRLTLTQSTVESVEAAAPVEERLRYLHAIVCVDTLHLFLASFDYESKPEATRRARQRSACPCRVRVAACTRLCLRGWCEPMIVTRSNAADPHRSRAANRRSCGCGGKNGLRAENVRHTSGFAPCPKRRAARRRCSQLPAAVGDQARPRVQLRQDRRVPVGRGDVRGARPLGRGRELLQALGEAQQGAGARREAARARRPDARDARRPRRPHRRPRALDESLGALAREVKDRARDDDVGPTSSS